MAGFSKRKQGELGGFSDRTSDIILVIFSVLILVIVAYPLYYVLVASFSDPYDVYAGKTFLVPSQFTLSGYQAVFAEPNIVRGYGNSILYTVVGTIFSVAMIYLVAYPLSVPDLPGKKLVSIFFIITMYFGGGLIPTYLIVQKTGIMQTIWAMFLPGGVAVSNAIIARNYFESSIPGSLKEAANIDGASHFRIFFAMIIPLSMPILSVMVVFSMVAYWNDWFTALIYMTNEQAPLPLVLRNILIKVFHIRQPGQHDQRWLCRAEQDDGNDQVCFHYRGSRSHADCVSLRPEVLRKGPDGRRCQGLI